MYFLFSQYESKRANREIWVALEDIQVNSWVWLVAAIHDTSIPIKLTCTLRKVLWR